MESKELMTKRRIEIIASEYEQYGAIDLPAISLNDNRRIDVFVSHSSSDFPVVAAIKRGMQLSTHMIVIFSNKTIKSTWVPWEIGYGDATSTEIAILKMIDIKKNQLPDYMQVAKVLYDIYDLNVFISHIYNKTTEQLVNEGIVRQYDSQLNNLRGEVESFVRSY